MGELPPDKTEEQRAHDAFLRWQEVRRVHLGHTTNIVLTLATAALGFGVKALLDAGISAPSLHTITLSSSLLVISAIFLGLSVLLGLAVNWTRLLDFRYTARTARSRQLSERAKRGEQLSEEQKSSVENRQVYRRRAKISERRTWCFLPAQLGCFAMGGIVGLIWFLLLPGSMESRDVPVTGEVFTVDINGSTPAPGASIRAYGLHCSGRHDLRFLERLIDCDGASDLLAQRFAAADDGVPAEYLHGHLAVHSSTEPTALDEWKEVVGSPGFAGLSTRKRREVRRVFFRRRLLRPEALWDGTVKDFAGYIGRIRKFFDDDPSFLESLPREEASDRLAALYDTWDSTLEDLNQREYQAVTAAVSDRSGSFAFALRPGRYMFVGIGKVKYSESFGKYSYENLGNAAWVRVISVEAGTKVVLAGPVCKPKTLRELQDAIRQPTKP